MDETAPPEIRRIPPVKAIRYSGPNFAVIEQPDDEYDGEKGGRMLQFFYPQTGELIEFPMPVSNAETLGRLLLHGPGGDDGGEPDAPVPSDLPPTPDTPPIEAEASSSPEPVGAGSVPPMH